MAHPRTRLCGGVDVDGDKRERFVMQWSMPAFSSIDELLRAAQPDLWSICTHADTHLELTHRAIEAGAKAIWCEKPLADTLDQAKQLVKICEEANVSLSVNHSRRFDRFHQDVARRIQSGEWGKVQRILIHYARGIANYGSHAFDLLRFFLGDEIAWVSATDELRESSTDRSLTVHGMTRGGTPFSLLPIRRELYDSLEVDVWGSAGRVTITHLGKGLRQYHVGASPYWDEPQVLLESSGEIASGMKNMITNGIENVINHIERGEPLWSSGRDGLAAFAAVAATQISARNNGERIITGDFL
jgi:predicted dehydrogenase